MRLFNDIDSFDLRDYRAARRGPDILLATRCYGGSASSASSAPTTTLTSTEGGIAGAEGAVAGGQGSLNVGAGSKYLEQGSVDVGTSSSNNSGTILGAGASQTETTTNTNLSGSNAKTVGGNDYSNASIHAVGGNELSGNAKTVGGNDLSGASFNITDNGAVRAATDLAGRVVDTQASGFQSALDTLTAGHAADLSTVTQFGSGALSALGDILSSSNNTSQAALDTLAKEFATQQQTESQNLNTISGTVTGALNQLNSLQQSQAAGAGSQLLTVIEYIALAVAAVFGLWLFFGKKAH